MGFKDELNQLTHGVYRFEEPMKRHTALGVGGKAFCFAEVDSLYGLNLLISIAKRFRVKYKVIGNGTNLLVSDTGFNGLIIRLTKLTDVFLKKDQVRAMAGAGLNKLINFAIDNKLTGVESLFGIPATVGGAIVMNASAFGHNISDYLTTVETLNNGKIKVYDKSDCKFGYRKSRFLGKKEVVVSACFHFPKREENDLPFAQLKRYRDLRKATQPVGKSCGSVFKNNKNLCAGELIDKAGLKGYSIGGARVSTKHGNFIIADARANASDVYSLIKFIKRQIWEKYSVQLEEEVEYLGEF